MAIVKRMSSKATVSKLEKYLKQEDKTEYKLISGMNCDSDDFAKQCELTNSLYNKNQKKDERKYYHIVQSFSPLEKNLTPEQAHKIGEQFAQKNFKGFDVLIITHTDKDHLHNHFVINSVSLETGKKYRADNKSLWNLRRTSNELCKQNGLVNSIQDLDKRANEKIQSGELRKLVRGDKTWKSELKSQIVDCAISSNNVKDFKEKMKEKYNVEVTERERTSKGQKKIIYQYQPQGFRKPCGEHRLGEDYGKEHIRNGFIRRSKEETRENESRNFAEKPAGTDTVRRIEIDDTEIRIAELEIKRAEQKIANNDREREQSKGQRNRTVENGVEPEPKTKKPTHEPRSR